VVDTGSLATALPSEVVRKLGIKPQTRRRLTLADGSSTVKDVGTALIQIDGCETRDDLVCIDKGPLRRVCWREKGPVTAFAG